MGAVPPSAWARVRRRWPGPRSSWSGAALSARGVPWTFVGVTTRGDVDRRHLAEIGGTGLFVGAVRDALRAGEIDVAVHSLKDLPTGTEMDLEVTAVPAREDTRDVLIGRRLADLGDGVRIGTGSPRRAMQLHDWAARSGIALEVVPIRGNVDTRIGLAARGELDAVVLAAAGLRRLGYLTDAESEADGTVVCGLPAEILDHAVMLPAPGQGALALETSTALDAERPGRGGRARRARRPGRGPGRAGLSRRSGGRLHRTGGIPRRCQICPWYKRRFDSDGGNWENLTEQLGRAPSSGLRPPIRGAWRLV